MATPSVDKPTVAIFLDIDGVLLPTKWPDDLYNKVRTATKLLFGADKVFPGDRNATEANSLTKLQAKVALSHFLHVRAVYFLNSLIQNLLNNDVDVKVVISSAWRTGASVEVLKEELFKPHFFSQFIVDKTPDDSFEDLKNNLTKNDFRGYQINYWLKTSGEKYKINEFIIFDDCDLKISSLFKNQFVRIKEEDAILGEEHISRSWEILSKKLPLKEFEVVPPSKRVKIETPQ